MKRYILFILIMLSGGNLLAENYELSFEGTGDTTIVDSVRIQNLANGQEITVAGEDILDVAVTPTINSIPEFRSDVFSVNITPNPITDFSRIEINSLSSDIYSIGVFDISGKMVTQIIRVLAAGKHIFNIQGLHEGIYLLSIAGKSNTTSLKLLVEGANINSPQLTYVSGSTNYAVANHSELNSVKSAVENVDLECNEGDCLMLTGFAGKYSSVITLTPETSTTISFDFHRCIDADTNSYKVVSINNQVWMAENLKTTRYNDESEIPLITDAAVWADWENTTAPGYCWYNNNPDEYKDSNGALYNWYAVDTLSNGGKNVCPSGWHVPSNDEWTELIDYLGGIDEAGGKMKSTISSGWSSPNTGASNTSGFTGLATGLRMWDGPFNFSGERGVYWSSTENGEYGSWMRRLAYDDRGVLETFSYKGFGFSVRCKKDE